MLLMRPGRGLPDPVDTIGFWKFSRFWLVAVVVICAVCALQIAVPAKRVSLPCALIFLIGVGVTIARRRSRVKDARAIRLAGLSRDGVPSKVVELVAVDKKIHAIKCYQESTGVSQREAKAVIEILAGLRRDGVPLPSTKEAADLNS
jgi:hypothetical protein